MDRIDADLLEAVADIHETPIGAYNIRKNGQAMGRRSSANIDIVSKEDKPGIDIIIKPGTKHESVHIPVILTETGLDDVVYNDFYIGEDADVVIVAGCGIHNCGDQKSQHDGIHTFHVGKNARVKYIEKHYGEGEGTGDKVLNPTTVVYMDENSYADMEMVQIKGVDSTKRDTSAHLQSGAKLVITERLMTHGSQFAESNVDISLDGDDASTQVISRTVGTDDSVQIFHPRVIGNASCRAHVQCDSIIMGDAKISSIPEIDAQNSDAQLIHEAAIGKINNDQLLKLMTFGMTQDEAEEVIIQGFLK
ncbi:MAG TPA: SufD family Fe-S cluster assembly protein [Candidatus Scubalenecus merdavium]|uniref:SufD family Fe-S cluster assembly protein n=1 Tax=Candidatus Scybalenecus merdavium TaxID=2840939 RepID=A0A9D1MUD9_9FIRM|nr:SufD family Fe-S cluster assembly protein [Candidatus Scubalenecus merdavium]